MAEGGYQYKRFFLDSAGAQFDHRRSRWQVETRGDFHLVVEHLLFEYPAWALSRWHILAESRLITGPALTDLWLSIRTATLLA
jgi:hypothetical protein